MVADRPAVDALTMNAWSARSQGGAATAQRERFVERADRSSRHRRRRSHRSHAPLVPLPRQTERYCAQRQSPTGIRQSPQQPHAGFRRRLAIESRTAEQPEICADSTPLALTGAVSARRPLCTHDAAGVTLRHCNDGRQAKTISGPLPSAVHPSATISLRIEREIMYR